MAAISAADLLVCNMATIDEQLTQDRLILTVIFVFIYYWVTLIPLQSKADLDSILACSCMESKKN